MKKLDIRLAKEQDKKRAQQQLVLIERLQMEAFTDIISLWMFLVLVCSMSFMDK